MLRKVFFIAPLFALLFAFGCTGSEPENEKIDELEEFVIQVEKSVEDGEVKDWNEFEQEFHQRLDHIEENTDELSQDVEQRMDELERRFEKLKSDNQ